MAEQDYKGYQQGWGTSASANYGLSEGKPDNISQAAWDALKKQKETDKFLAGAYGEMPEYQQQSMVDPATGQLMSGFQLEAQMMDPGAIAGYDKFSEFAQGVGPSEYAQEAQKGLDLKTAFERDRISAQESGQAAQGRAGLAMRGGLSGGARERVGQSVMQGGQDARQGARQAQLMGTAGLLSEDAKSRQGALERFTGMGQQMQQFDIGNKMQAGQFNISNALAQKESDRAAEERRLDKRREQVAQQKKSAEEQMMEADRDKGMFGTQFLCTELRERKLIGQFEGAQLYHKLFVPSTLTRADFFAWYYNEGDKIVDEANRQGLDWKVLKPRIVDDVLRVLKHSGLEAAQDVYIYRTQELNELLGNPAPGFKDSFHKGSMLKSIAAWPKLFSTKKFRFWAKAHFTKKYRPIMLKGEI